MSKAKNPSIAVLKRENGAEKIGYGLKTVAEAMGELRADIDNGDLKPLEAFGGKAKVGFDNYPAMVQAISEQGGFVALGDAYEYNGELELSDTSSTADNRRSVEIRGNGSTVFYPTHATGYAVKHSQTLAQAEAAPSFTARVYLNGCRFDGSKAGAGVSAAKWHGIRLLVFNDCQFQKFGGEGLHYPADSSFDSVGTDDVYAVLLTVIKGTTIRECGGWGIKQEMFAAPILWLQNYVANNQGGGLWLCAGKSEFRGGAVAYNGTAGDTEAAGIRLTKTTTVTNSSASNSMFSTIEIDRNHNHNIWLEDGYLHKFERCRLIDGSPTEPYIQKSIIKFGGTAGMTPFDNKIKDCYVRAIGDSSNPAGVLVNFASGDNNRVTGYRLLSGASPNFNVYADNGGQRCLLTDSIGRVKYSDYPEVSLNYVQARITSAQSVGTSVAALLFDDVQYDFEGLYDAATGEYISTGGVFEIEGFVTIESAPADTLLTIILDVDSGGGFAGLKSQSQVVPAALTLGAALFRFQSYIAPGAKIRVSAFANGSRNLSASAQRSGLTIRRV